MMTKPSKFPLLDEPARSRDEWNCSHLPKVQLSRDDQHLFHALHLPGALIAFRNNLVQIKNNLSWMRLRIYITKI